MLSDRVQNLAESEVFLIVFSLLILSYGGSPVPFVALIFMLRLKQLGSSTPANKQ